MTSLTISNAVDAVIMRPAGSTGRPSLSLDFLADPTTALSRLTFTRASSATRINASGLLETVSNNVARLDYDPVTKVARGLLVESTAINLIANNTMSGATVGTPGSVPTGWNVSGSGNGITRTVVGTGTEAGINYIDLRYQGTVTGSTYGGFALFGGALDFPLSAGDLRCVSSYLKLVAGSFAGLTFAALCLDWYTAAVAFISSTQTSILGLTNSGLAAQRTATSGTAPATTAYTRPVIQWAIPVGVTADFTLRIGMPQVEAGLFATSVIATAGTTATRAADVATMATSAFPFNAAAGTFILRTAPLAVVGTLPALTVDDGSANERYRVVNDAGTWKAQVTDGGVSQADISVGSAAAGTLAALGFTYAVNDVAAVLNSGTVGTDGSATLPTVTTVSFGSGRHRFLEYYPRRMPNTELQAKTA